MSELGSLLELIHDAHDRVTTFEAEYRDWIRPRPSLELHVERPKPGETHACWRGAGPFPKALVNTRRIWLMAPDNLRVEVLREHRLFRLGVLTPDRWWRWDLEWGTVCGQAASDDMESPTPPPPLLTPPLVSPASLLAVMRFEVIGFGVRAGRKVVRARGLPRRPPATGGVRHEFDFDAQHGTVLRSAAIDNGHVVSVTEAISAAYDRPMNPERFVFTAPDGRPAPRVGLTAPALKGTTGQLDGDGSPAKNGHVAARHSGGKRPERPMS
jgi:hypothetical protein